MILFTYTGGINFTTNVTALRQHNFRNHHCLLLQLCKGEDPSDGFALDRELVGNAVGVHWTTSVPKKVGSIDGPEYSETEQR
mmetsp:Transcript_29515/g.40556  ORF Transcript_29515/g.40556 Transcript_29515/m.40556 type:complete len:82 (-) Transcript_29515:17-262(-)